MIRRLGQQDQRWFEGQDFVATKLVLTCGPDLLVLLRDDFDHIPFPGHWDLPGGGREGAETPAECALRELREETGLALTPDRLRHWQEFPGPGGAGKWAIFFTGTITQAEVASITLGDEGQDCRMMPVREYIAHPLAVPHFRSRVTYCLGLTAISP